MHLHDMRSFSIFDGLTDDQLGQLLAPSHEVSVEPGVDLWHQGDHADHWWVLLDGAIDIIRHVGREDTVMGRIDVPGRWAGGFRAWDENGVYLASGRGVVAGRVLRVPAEVLRDLTDAWFPLAGHLLKGVFRTARSVESTVRQREALVKLGTLSAGLAHELNNPAAAAARAADTLDSACQTLLSSLNRLAQDDITAGQFRALDQLRREIGPRSIAVDALAMADLEDVLSTWLADHDVEREWVIAPALAAAGVDVAWCERAAEVLGGPALGRVLEWVAATFSVSTLVDEVKESTRRVSDLVATVRSYSQMDRASLQRTDVTEGLESTLAMLGHKLRDGVTVVRDYADLPRIDAYAGELNQVWTNLLDNAIDAMDGRGTLRVTARAEEDAIVVEIGDTGPGMAPDVAARAFEAFYTTKDVGKGTGLGLDIARRIVEERHDGTISIDSRPGDTILRVRIPVRRRG